MRGLSHHLLTNGKASKVKKTGRKHVVKIVTHGLKHPSRQGRSKRLKPIDIAMFYRAGQGRAKQLRIYQANLTLHEMHLATGGHYVKQRVLRIVRHQARGLSARTLR